jgi:hypothetical protein
MRDYALGQYKGRAPPSYESALYKELWSIVAPYVHTSGLYNACLVSRSWHHIFSPFLWSHPGSRFGIDNDDVYCEFWHFPSGPSPDIVFSLENWIY